jgi:Arc/MetJ-type ribon-helix-helix transcriptional regulator
MWMVLGWFMESKDIAAKRSARAPVTDSEKITINVGVVDLGQIDLLVQEGFYSNRTDLIRTAIRNQIATHAEAVRQTVARRTLVLGLQDLSRADLEAAVQSGTKLRLRVLGLVRIADDVSPALATQAIESICVLGALHATPAVKAALADRLS